MALQKEKNEKERKSYLKNSKGSEIQAKNKMGETPKVEKLKKRCENGKM